MSDELFDWDEANANHIWDEHRISIDEAEQVFEDVSRFSRRSNTEREARAVVVGATYSGRLLAVVTTFRAGRVWVVTAREANKWEKQHYRGRKRR